MADKKKRKRSDGRTEVQSEDGSWVIDWAISSMSDSAPSYDSSPSYDSGSSDSGSDCGSCDCGGGD